MSCILTQSLNSSGGIDNILDFLIEQTENSNETFNEPIHSGEEGNNNSKIIYLKQNMLPARRSYTHKNKKIKEVHEDAENLAFKKDNESYDEYSEEVLVEIVDSADENSTRDFQEHSKQNINQNLKQSQVRRSGNMESAKKALHTFFPKAHDVNSILHEYPDILNDQFSNKRNNVDSYVQNMFFLPTARSNEYPYEAPNTGIANENLKQEKIKENNFNHIVKSPKPFTLQNKLPDTSYYTDNPNNYYSNSDAPDNFSYNVGAPNIFYPSVKKHIKSYNPPPSVNQEYGLQLPPFNLLTQALLNEVNPNMKYYENSRRGYNPYFITNLAALPQNIIRTVIHHQGKPCCKSRYST